jgi:peptide/nickel transport system permease protein
MERMIPYLIRRLFQLVIVLLGITFITFGVLKVTPGDPARALAGKLATPERIAFIRHQRGLDRPFYVQYVKYLEATARGDLGVSFYTGRPVSELILEAAPITIQLAVAALLVALLGIPLGVYSAVHQYTVWDTALTALALVLWGVPAFVLGPMLLWVFGLKLQWLPLYGVGDMTLGFLPAGWDGLSRLILPALALGITEVALISYMQRASMLDVSRSDYIRTAHAKGLSERRVVWGHGFKNAVIPVMTIVGIDLGTLMGGAVIVEVIFTRPGIGLLLLKAVGDRDAAVIAGCTLFVSFFFVIANLLVDLGYAWVDPRVRLGE